MCMLIGHRHLFRLEKDAGRESCNQNKSTEQSETFLLYVGIGFHLCILLGNFLLKTAFFHMNQKPIYAVAKVLCKESQASLRLKIITLP